MNAFISLEFVYKSQTYYALVRKRLPKVNNRYQVTVMNSGLNHLLCGHDVLIVDQQGDLHATPCEKNGDTDKLLQSIMNAFRNRLQSTPVR